MNFQASVTGAETSLMTSLSTKILKKDWLTKVGCLRGMPEKESDAIDQELAEYDDEQPYGFEPECYMDADGYCSAAGRV